MPMSGADAYELYVLAIVAGLMLACVGASLVFAFFWVRQDITDQRARAEAAEEDAARLRSLVETIERMQRIRRDTLALMAREAQQR